MEVKLPIKLNEDVFGTVSIRIRLSKDMRMLSMEKGYEPEEIENMVGQALTALGLQVAEILGVGDSPRR